MTAGLEFRINIKAFSDSISFKALAPRLGPHARVVYEKGETMRTRNGHSTSLRSDENYLATVDTTLAGPASLDRTIREQMAVISGDPALSGLTRSRDGRVYVSIAIFGHFPRETGSLGIDTGLFGHGVGLMVDNYTILSESGAPQELEIAPSGRG